MRVITRHLPIGSWFLGFGIFFLSALITFAPLGLYFAQHPEDFLNRAGQVAVRPGEEGLLLYGLRRAAEMIVLDGEPYDRFNIPGQPLFSGLLAVLFVIGFVITVIRFIRSFTRSSTPPIRLATELLLLAWLPFMLLPTALAVHDILPSNVRAFGVMPLLFVFPARGLIAAFRGVLRYAPGPLLPTAYPLTVIGLVMLGAGTAAAYRDYFEVWANYPTHDFNQDADIVEMARYLNQQDLTNTTPYMSAIHYRHPTAAYLARDFGAIRWLTGGEALVIPSGHSALYLFGRTAPPPDDWIAGWAPYLEKVSPGRDNAPNYRVYRVAAGEAVPLPEFAPLNANFGNAIFLTGSRYVAQDDALNVDLLWRVENVVEMSDLLPYARLIDAHGREWADSGNFTYPSEQWTPGDVLLTRQVIKLPAGLPPGEYTVRVGLYSASRQFDLPRVNAQGGYGGRRVPLGPVQLTGGPVVGEAEFRAATAMSSPGENDLRGDLELMGYTASAPSVRQNDRLVLTLFWYARTTIAADSLTITLGDRPLFSGQPAQNLFPFRRWAPEQMLIDRYTLRIPPDFPPGPAPLNVQVPGYGAARLATIDVAAVERTFIPPPSAQSVEAQFGSGITLYGYTVEPGAETRLALVWRSRAAVDVQSTDYTVFVHVLGEAGQIVAQVDAMPRGGAYPTSFWVPGEYVTDSFSFQLPPGEYSLAVGLYNLETGERLQLSGGQDDHLLIGPFDVP